MPTTESRLRTEMQLKNQSLSFSAAYLAVQYLTNHIHSHPNHVTEETFQALATLGDSNRFNGKKQALFLYRLTFDAMVALALAKTAIVPTKIFNWLQNLLLNSKGPKKRAISQALGDLPLQFFPPDDPLSKSPALPIGFTALMTAFGNPKPDDIHWKGRSLCFTISPGNLGTIKFATSPENVPDLLKESHWLTYLSQNPPCDDFKLPQSLKIKGCTLFNIQNMPPELNTHGVTQFPAIGFTCTPDYYAYPNESDQLLPKEQALDLFETNAHKLGALTGRGIIHTALIPLFHNRVQQNLRNDNGYYLWELGGRLDQWLNSCKFPNFATSGIRDFEHILCLKNQKRLHHFIGEHLLGFILVIGSYFRARAPEQMGYDNAGRPADTRTHFDPTLMVQLIQKVVKGYCLGLNQSCPSSLNDLPYENLCRELIEKMGVDEFMEEVLRLRDQEDMTRLEFDMFLKERGVASPAAIEKGARDIELITGPHLGGFNQPISTPALIEFLFQTTAILVLEQYQTQRI